MYYILWKAHRLAIFAIRSPIVRVHIGKSYGKSEGCMFTITPISICMFDYVKMLKGYEMTFYLGLNDKLMVD